MTQTFLNHLSLIRGVVCHPVLTISLLCLVHVLQFVSKFLLVHMGLWLCFFLQAAGKPRQHALVARDMASFMCLVCEMFLAPRLRMQEEEPSLVKRLQNIRALCGADISMIPR